MDGDAKEQMSAVQQIEMYKCAEKVTAELEAMRYNNAVSQGVGRWHRLTAIGQMLLVACICCLTQQRHSFVSGIFSTDAFRSRIDFKYDVVRQRGYQVGQLPA